MKRDMDLIREILRLIEARPESEECAFVTIEGRSPGKVRHHLELMRDAGLIDKVSFSSSGAIVQRLTYAGHDFLEAARKDTIWQKAKDIAITKTGGLSVAALTEALKIAVKMAITGSA